MLNDQTVLDRTVGQLFSSTGVMELTVNRIQLTQVTPGCLRNRFIATRGSSTLKWIFLQNASSLLP